jgi:hypothetical protein
MIKAGDSLYNIATQRYVCVIIAVMGSVRVSHKPVYSIARSLGLSLDSTRPLIMIASKRRTNSQAVCLSVASQWVKASPESPLWVRSFG